MSTLSILHRDIKLTNIFIGKNSSHSHRLYIIDVRFVIFVDAKGDCKGDENFANHSIDDFQSHCVNPVGDFGLATSSLAAVDPSDVSPHVITPEADMTLGM